MEILQKHVYKKFYVHETAAVNRKFVKNLTPEKRKENINQTFQRLLSAVTLDSILKLSYINHTFELLKNEERPKWFCACFPELPFLDMLLLENTAHGILLKI